MRRKTEIEIENLINESRSKEWVKDVISESLDFVCSWSACSLRRGVIGEKVNRMIDKKLSDVLERLKKLEALTKANEYKWETETKLVKIKKEVNNDN